MHGQMSMDTTSVLWIDSISQTSWDWSVYLGGNDSTVSVHFDTISNKQFVGYSKRYRSKLNLTKNISVKDSSFILQMDQKEVVFNTVVTDDFPWNEYVGLLEPLNLYVVLNVDGRNETGSLNLIDKRTGKTYYFTSPFDYPCETVRLSPKNQYLLSFANNWYENNQSFISILKIDRSGKQYKLKAFVSLDITQWTVNDIVWIDDHRFALSVKEKIDLENNETGTGKDFCLIGSF